MKDLYTLLFVFLISSGITFAQNPFMAGVSYGANKAELVDSSPMACGSAFYAKKYFQEVGVSVAKRIGRKWEIQSGLIYGSGEVMINADYGEGVEPHSYADISIYSIPVQMKFYPLPFVFIAAGPVFDFGERDSSFDQSGVGFQGGIGGQYQTGRVRFTIMPNVKMHRAFGGDKLDANGRVGLTGIQFGMAYQLGSK